MIGALAGSTLRLPDLPMAGTTGTVQPGPAAQTASPSAFASVLQDYAASLKSGEAAAIAGVEGRIPLQSMVDQILSTERTLQATLAVRDKIVSSFLEISRMQI